MTRRDILRVAPALLLRQARSQPNRPPNIVFLYTDDQARWAVSSYGNRDVHSPNMDRIAREGALFDQAFVSTPVCSPSRASLLTGQRSFRTGIRDFIDVRREPELGLSASFPSWPELLQQTGYRTGLFGKWHLGTRPEHHPTKRGYRHFTGVLEGGNTPMNPWLEVAGREQRVEGSLPDVLSDAAIEFIKTNRQSPFLVSLHFRAPHSPYGPVPAEDTAAVAGRLPSVPEAPGIDKAQVSKLLHAYYASVPPSTAISDECSKLWTAWIWPGTPSSFSHRTTAT